MALVEGCKHSLEISVPEEEVAAETEKVVGELQKKVRLPGFRPGKAPVSIIRQRFESDIRQDVLEQLVPKSFHKRVENEGLKVIGRPSVSDVKFEKGEGLRYTIEFEVAPEVELGDLSDLTVEYEEPVVSDADIDERLAALRESKAEYVNLDPRPVEDGDYVQVALESIAGVQPPVKSDEVQLHVGGEDTLPGFTENLLGMQPGEVKEFDVQYPEDYGEEKLAGKTVRFRMELKVVRRKELPEIDDEFATSLGDFKNLEELRGTLRQSIFAEKENAAKEAAKNQLVDKLVDAHEFPVPEAYTDRHLELKVSSYLRGMQARGVDPSNLQLDWEKLKASQYDRAVREVKASLLLERLADRESIYATQDEVDRQVQRIARERRQPVAAVRMTLEKEGVLDRLSSNIRTEKTLDHLFDRARKVVPQPKQD